jgi:hypothetical protein
VPAGAIARQRAQLAARADLDHARRRRDRRAEQGAGELEELSLRRGSGRGLADAGQYGLAAGAGTAVGLVDRGAGRRRACAV